jgi:hypothetical protein
MMLRRKSQTSHITFPFGKKEQKGKEPEEREIELQRPGVPSGPSLREIDIKLQRPNFNSQFQSYENKKGVIIFFFLSNSLSVGPLIFPPPSP